MGKIVFFTEMGFVGKIPRTHPNMRTEFAQMCALGADHYPMLEIQQVQEQYDIAILLIGKTTKFREQIANLNVVSEARKFAKRVMWMQEGPSWIFQDLPLNQQFWHYNVLAEVDGILTENKTDIPYFKGLLGDEKPIHDIPSLMIMTDEAGNALYNFSEEKEDAVIIGGNFVRWYGGFDSYIVAREFAPSYKLSCVSMGRKQTQEDLIEDLQYLPYMQWADWIQTLSKFKVGVHLMPTIAAGTFAMNCGYLGTPCIGYGEADTQRLIHPDLTVGFNEIGKARKLANRLQTDKHFYEHCSTQAKLNWEKYFSEQAFLTHMKQVLQ